MTYGDGDGISYNPFTCLDIVGHEITHGVTEHTANLVYSYESGALNESFSDIFGACISHFANPAGFSWHQGGAISISGLTGRRMDDPNVFNDPDTYQGDFWHTSSADYGGVHTNSGVQNFWFYLLTDGGSGTNDNGEFYSVQGIGIADAARIAFRNLSVYLNNSSQFADARTFSIQSALDLFGNCSDQVVAVTNAWHAVGVGPAFNGSISAGFITDANYSCVTPATIVFDNISNNATSYVWNFGDGTTSTATSPSHVYTTTGSYTVSLIANGSTACNSSDTLILSQSIVIENGSPVTVASCQPNPSNPLSNGGILEFQFGNIINESTGSPSGYQDFSCNFNTTVTEGMSYPMEVVMNSSSYLNMWIDLDNNGSFTSSELVYASSTPAVTVSTDLIIPAASIFNSALRVRLISDNQPISSSCSVTIEGQAEDYSISIVDNNAAPLANFTSNTVSVLVGETISMEDLSLNAPTTWQWSFPGATTTSSNLQNPQVSYGSMGTYDVQLIVSNTHGSDTLLIPDYISVVNMFNLCDVSATGAPSGIFYDPGGPSGNYGNADNCSLLIAPPCAQNITLSFNSFNVESGYDNLRVYDGNTNMAPLLGTLTGGSIPVPITSTGGELFLTWGTDGSVTYVGFEAEWSSIIGSQDTLITVATADDINPAFGQVVNFSDLSVESPYDWQWDFGDGNTSTDQNPSHSYLTSGSQTVTLTATNCVSTDVDTMVVNVQQPGGFSVDPPSLDVLFPNCEDSITTNIWVYNTGAGDLILEQSSGILYDDFEGATVNNDIWSSVTGTVSDNCGTNAGSGALYFDVNGIREAITVPIELDAAGELGFHLKYGNSSYPCDEIDGNEYARVEYSMNGGTSFVSYMAFTVESDFDFFSPVTIPVPSDAIGVPTMYRITQYYADGTTDNWSIDDFYIGGNASPLTMNPDSALVLAGDSVMIAVTVYREGMVAGDYQTELVIQTNDPFASEVIIPINYTIEGSGILSYNQTCINFDTIQEFASNSDSVYFYNTGCAEIVIDSIIPSNPDFQYTTSSMTVAPYDTLGIEVLFSPSAYGVFNDSLIIYYDGLEDTTLCLNGIAVPAPIISTIPTMLDFHLPNCEDSVSTSIWIYNTGAGDLNAQQANLLYDDFEGTTVNTNIWSSVTGTLSANCGTNTGNGALYFDVNGVREAVTLPIELDANGELGFYLKYGNSSYPCDEIDGSEYARVEYSTNGGTSFSSYMAFTVENDFDFFSPVTIPVPLDAIGVPTMYRITQYYADGTTDNWSIDDFYIGGNTPAATMTPDSVFVLAGDSVLVDFTFARNGMTQGFYSDTVWLSSNDPVNSGLPIPVHITIDGDGILQMDTACIEFAEIQEYTTTTDSIQLYNVGCAPLTLSGFTTTTSEFVVNQGALILQPNDSVYVQVTYAPTLFGIHTGELVFLADTVTYHRCLEGSAIGSSQISVSPDPVVIYGQNCPDTVQSNFTIYNSGNAPLNWTIASSMFDDFEGNGYNSALWEYSSGYNSNICGSHGGSYSHRFSNSGSRYIQTQAFSMNSNTVINFYLLYGTGSGSCEAVDAGEYVVLEYSLDGTFWVNFASFSNLSSYSNWGLVSETLPVAATSGQTQIRIRQLSNSGSSNDHWVIDDVSLTAGNSGSFDFVPDNGIVSVDDSTTVSVILDASSMDAGFYLDSIHIISDDPTLPDYILPIEITIEGDPQLSYVESGCVNLGSIFENTSSTDSIYLENTGCAPLIFSSISIPNSPFSFGQYPDTIHSNEGVWLEVLFEPVSVGSFTEQITILSNGGNISICVEGEGLAAPDIEVLPPSIQIDFEACNDTIIYDLLIQNNGGSSLEYTTNNLYLNSEINLDTILSRWLTNYNDITSLIPSPFLFSNGITSYYISDGGSDMYDSGNRLRTDNTNTIYYSNNSIVGSTAFGTNGQYFTSKVDGMFIAVADLDDVYEFEVFGGLGQDGFGSIDVTTLTYQLGDTEFTGYVKRMYGASNPSVNHIIITETNNSIVRDYSTSTYYEDHSLTNLQNNDRVFYLLFASTSGGYVNDNQMQSIMEAFIDNLLQENYFLVDIDPASETVAPSSSEQVTLTFVNAGSAAGSYNSTITINSNDPLNPVVEVPVVVNVPNIPCSSFDFEYVNGCQGEVQFINETVNDVGIWSWDFGDGTVSGAEHPVHIYENSGYYTVTLTAGSGLLADSYSTQVFVQPISASFIFTDADSNNGTVDFASTSPQAAEWLWNFGDGGTSTEEFPTHIYGSPGTYVVTLYVWDANGCPGFTSLTVEYGIDGVEDEIFSKIEVFPNPSKGEFVLRHEGNNQPIELNILDETGRVILNIERIAPIEQHIDISQYADGIYILKIGIGDAIHHMRIVKQ